MATNPRTDSDPAPLLAKMGPMMEKIPIQAVELAAGLHLIQGPGGNIAVLDGPDGLTVVNSGVPMRAREVLETVKRVGGKPVSRLINTHWHFDHAGGNEVFARPGRRSSRPRPRGSGWRPTSIPKCSR